MFVAVAFCPFHSFYVICRKMPIKEFHLDRVLRDLEMTHDQVGCVALYCLA